MIPTGSPLLRAKLRAPSASDHFVRRPRLDDLLDDLVRVPLTLVLAPAGSGKSAVVAGWVEHTQLPVSWLSLDDSDRDARQLWAGVIAALDGTSPGVGEGAIGLLRRGEPVDRVVARLLDDVEQVEVDTLVLVIDDLHLVDGDEEVNRSLSAFLQHLPSCLRVVALSRRQPVLPIDRLRGRGQLGEIHLAELRLSDGEAAEMLRRLAPAMEPDDVEEVIGVVAGWAAGLQIAAVAARADRARGGLGSVVEERAVVLDDFVWHEVLALERDDLVQALLDVAVADRVNHALASALTGRADAVDLLREAEARGLFVSRLGVEGWFEIHSLVRSALLAHLARSTPERLVTQHERAARWFEAAGEVPAALDHWMSAGCPRQALRLLAMAHGSLYDAGREAVVRRTLAAIPPEVAGDDVDAMADLTWCHLLLSRVAFAEGVERASRFAEGRPLDDMQIGRLRVLQAIDRVVHADWAASAVLAREGLDRLGDRWRTDPIGRFGWNLVAREIALGERWDDRSDEVRAVEAAVSGDPERRLAFEGTRALGLVLAGHPIEALQTVAGIRHATEVTNMTILRAEVGLAEGLAHRELGDRERATEELGVIADTPAETMVYCRLLAMLALAADMASAGDRERARARMDEAVDLAVSAGLGAGADDWLARVGTLVALAEVDGPGAARWADQVGDPFWRSAGTARTLLAAGERSGAAEVLVLAEPRCVRHEVILGLLRAEAIDDRDEASKAGVAALEVASSTGLLKTVADEGPLGLDLLERAAWRAPEAWLDRLRRVVATSRPVVGKALVEPLEPLTDRERDVLRFLPSRLTTREIADELYVSVNTLKFHLKVIYRKLGVSSRAEAAEKARRMTSS
jgi:LuxR family transcriptional regulator, maltose regulon positive regulatory protein